LGISSNTSTTTAKPITVAVNANSTKIKGDAKVTITQAKAGTSGGTGTPGDPETPGEPGTPENPETPGDTGKTEGGGSSGISTKPGTATIDITLELDNTNVVINDGNDITISKTSANSHNNSFTASVSGFTDIEWYVDGILEDIQPTITIDAVNRLAGTYRLNVRAYKDSMPYSAEIQFTVTD
jgi:hypothetical protein